MKINQFLLSLLLLSVVIPSQFELIEKSEETTKIKFSQENIILNPKGDFKEIHRALEGSTTEKGMPELPLHTTFFQMKQGIDYEVQYIVTTLS